MKKWYKSKFHWFNISLGIIGMVEINLHLLQNTLGNYYGFVLMLISGIGLVLRNVTPTSTEGTGDVR